LQPDELGRRTEGSQTRAGSYDFRMSVIKFIPVTFVVAIVRKLGNGGFLLHYINYSSRQPVENNKRLEWKSHVTTESQVRVNGVLSVNVVNAETTLKAQ
jgi:hypothetical protein